MNLHRSTPCTLGKARALVFALATVFCANAVAGAAQSSDRQRAKQQFRAGVALLRDPSGPRYEEAYRAFVGAYKIWPSYKILGNLGLCAMKLERDSEAIAAYSRYLTEGDDLTTSERQQIERDLRTLRTVSARLTVTVTPVDAQLVDQRLPTQGPAIVNRYRAKAGRFDLRIRPGQHRFALEHAHFKTIRWSAELEPGGRLERSFDLSSERPAQPQPDLAVPTPAPTGPPSQPGPTATGFWIGVAVTGALGVGTAITGGLALAKHGQFKDARDEGDIATAQTLKDEGQPLTIATDVLLGCTVVSAGITAALWFTRERAEDDDASASGNGSSTSTRVRVLPAIGDSSASLWLVGVF